MKHKHALSLLMLCFLFLFSACSAPASPSPTTSPSASTPSPSPSVFPLPEISDSIGSCKLQSPNQIRDLTRSKDMNLGFWVDDFVDRYKKIDSLGGNGSTSMDWSYDDCLFHFSFCRLQRAVIRSDRFSVMGDLRVGDSVEDVYSMFPGCCVSDYENIYLFFSSSGKLVPESEKYFSLVFSIDSGAVESGL